MEKRTVPHVHEDTYWSVVENRRVSGGCVVLDFKWVDIQNGL